MKLTDKVPAATHRVLVYGPPKVGKTQLVSELAAEFNLLWFDLEAGYATLLKLPQEHKERVELICIPDSRSYPIAVETMLKVIKGGKVSICEEHGKVSCPICKKDSKPEVTVCLNELSSEWIVVIDSLTQFSNSAIANITKNQPDDYKMDFDDWGNLKTLVEKFLSEVQVAKCNIVCISHEEEVKMEDGRQKIVPVCGSSKSSRNTAKYFDHVVYCEMKNKKHMFASATTYSMAALTGSRTDVTLEASEKPSLITIFNSHHHQAAAKPQTQGQVALTALQKLQAARTGTGVK